MKNKEQIAKDIEKLYQVQAERDLHERDEEEFNNITFETKLADYFIAEIEKANKDAKREVIDNVISNIAPLSAIFRVNATKENMESAYNFERWLMKYADKLKQQAQDKSEV